MTKIFYVSSQRFILNLKTLYKKYYYIFDHLKLCKYFCYIKMMISKFYIYNIWSLSVSSHIFSETLSLTGYIFTPFSSHKRYYIYIYKPEVREAWEEYLLWEIEKISLTDSICTIEMKPTMHWWGMWKLSKVLMSRQYIPNISRSYLIWLEIKYFPLPSKRTLTQKILTIMAVWKLQLNIPTTTVKTVIVDGVLGPTTTILVTVATSGKT